MVHQGMFGADMTVPIKTMEAKIGTSLILKMYGRITPSISNMFKSLDCVTVTCYKNASSFRMVLFSSLLQYLSMEGSI